MTDKFQNKYRIPSARLQTWDYRWEGAYFITICTQNRMHYFGEVVNNKMNLSRVGILADVFWHEIKNHSKNITFGEFVVMPNHIHSILIINPNSDGLSNVPDLNHIPLIISNENDFDNGNIIDDGNIIDIGNSIDIGIVQTRHALSPSDANKNSDANKIPPNSIGQNRFQNPGKNSISSIIGGYKSAVTKHANRLNLDFGWQTRFYDHIIRDGKAFDTISNYIINNPKKMGRR